MQFHHRIHQINIISSLPFSSRLCVYFRHHGCFSRRPFLLFDTPKISLAQRSPLVHQHRKYRAFDEDSFGIASLDEWGYDEGTYGYILSSSDDEECDGEIVLTPISDLDLPTSKLTTDDALTITAHRFGMLGRGSKKHRIRHGFLINMGLIIFLTILLLYVDWCAWRIVRLPLQPFYLTRPFFISAAVAACAGYICVPLLKSLNIHQIIRRRPIRHYKKRQTPTIGGLFFIPAGVAVAKFLARHSSKEVSGAAVATLAFALIGLLDDFFGLRNRNRGLPGWIRITLEAAVGICFSLWVDSTSIASPYGMKLLIPLPASLGLVSIGKFHLLLTSFCFISMGNGMNLTDGLDGLAGGTAALAFIGMSIAVLPICSDLAIFGASMGGACLGFLLHNRYRASVFMGDTGSLALGGALAAMAASSGMFFPLFISSGIFIVEALSVILQILYFKTTKYLWGAGHRLFRMAPVHYHLELCGLREPIIVAVTYVIGGLLSLLAGYVGLISA